MWVRVTFFVLLLSVCALLYVCHRRNSNETNRRLQEIERLSNDVSVHPSFMEISNHRTLKASVIGVHKYFKSDAKYDDVKKFYTKELSQNGWQFTEEIKIKDWGRDLGGYDLIFHKGEYYYSITYAGDQVDTTWNYSISIGWRRGDLDRPGASGHGEPASGADVRANGE